MQRALRGIKASNSTPLLAYGILSGVLWLPVWKIFFRGAVATSNKFALPEFYHTTADIHEWVKDFVESGKCNSFSVHSVSTIERFSSSKESQYIQFMKSVLSKFRLQISQPINLSKGEVLDAVTFRLSPRNGLKATGGGAEMKKSNAIEAVRTTRNANIVRVVAVFGEHARELISAEAGLAFMQSLCYCAGRKPAGRETVGDEASGKEPSGGETVGTVGISFSNTIPRNDLCRIELPDYNFEITILPNGNPVSRKLVEKGDFCRRINENGVDLNRNWADHWLPVERQATIKDTYPGEKPFTEEETILFRHLLLQQPPLDIFMSVHSGGCMFATPYAFNATAVSFTGLPGYSGSSGHSGRRATAVAGLQRVVGPQRSPGYSGRRATAVFAGP